MEKVNFIKNVNTVLCAVVLSAAPLVASAATTGTHSDQAIAVRLPGELCAVEERYLASLYRQILGRSDYKDLIDHMYESCPQQILGMGIPTEVITETPRREGEERITKTPERPGGEKPGGEKPGGEKPGGEQPGGEKPGGEKPGGEKPGGEKPGGEKGGREERGGEKAGREERGGEKAGREERGEERGGEGSRR